jgi:hypothetical protein
MKSLKDAYLLECYEKAVELKLDQEFIRLLKHEIERRQLRFEADPQQPFSGMPFAPRDLQAVGKPE